MTNPGPRTFVKSSWSGGDGGNCVEWAFTPTAVHVRDSKDRAGGELNFTFAEWDALATAAATGVEHDSIWVGEYLVRLTGRGSALFFTRAEWDAFVDGARAGECRRSLNTVR